MVTQGALPFHSLSKTRPQIDVVAEHFAKHRQYNTDSLAEAHKQPIEDRGLEDKVTFLPFFLQFF
jgi:hypothetical protein